MTSKLTALAVVVIAVLFAVIAYSYLIWSNCDSTANGFFSDFLAFHTREGC